MVGASGSGLGCRKLLDDLPFLFPQQSAVVNLQTVCCIIKAVCALTECGGWEGQINPCKNEDPDFGLSVRGPYSPSLLSVVGSASRMGGTSPSRPEYPCALHEQQLDVNVPVLSDI